MRVYVYAAMGQEIGLGPFTMTAVSSGVNALAKSLLAIKENGSTSGTRHGRGVDCSGIWLDENSSGVGYTDVRLDRRRNVISAGSVAIVLFCWTSGYLLRYLLLLLRHRMITPRHKVYLRPPPRYRYLLAPLSPAKLKLEGTRSHVIKFPCE